LRRVIVGDAVFWDIVSGERSKLFPIYEN